MNLIKRYVEAVKRYLPDKIREDVSEELSSLLEDKIEEKEEKKGQPLEEEEVGRVLKDYGHPMMVASQYQSRRVLISEPIFPIYKQTLKIALTVSMAVYLLMYVIRAIASFTWWPAGTIIDLLNALGSILLEGFALITIGFFLLDGVLQRIDFYRKWDPMKLPDTTGRSEIIPLHVTISRLVVLVILMVLLMNIKDQYSWAVFYLEVSSRILFSISLIIMLMIFTFGLYLYNIFRPFWTKIRHLCFTLIAFLFSLLLLNMTLGGNLIELIPNTVNTEYGVDEIANGEFWMNLWLRIVLGFFCISRFWDAARNVYKAFMFKKDTNDWDNKVKPEMP